MTCSEIIQSVLVGVLVIITGYYAYQTHRQVNLIEKQSKKENRGRALERIRDWAEEVLDILKRDSEKAQLPDRLEELCLWLHHSHAKGLGIEWDAVQIGGEVNRTVKYTLFAFAKFMCKIGMEENIKKNIDTFKKAYNVKEKIEPIRSGKELGKAIRETIDPFINIVALTTKYLVPSE